MQLEIPEMQLMIFEIGYQFWISLIEFRISSPAVFNVYFQLLALVKWNHKLLLLSIIVTLPPPMCPSFPLSLLG